RGPAPAAARAELADALARPHVDGPRGRVPSPAPRRAAAGPHHRDGRAVRAGDPEVLRQHALADEVLRRPRPDRPRPDGERRLAQPAPGLQLRPGRAAQVTVTQRREAVWLLLFVGACFGVAVYLFG